MFLIVHVRKDFANSVICLAFGAIAFGAVKQQKARILANGRILS